jgi:hypothetical protein
VSVLVLVLVPVPPDSLVLDSPSLDSLVLDSLVPLSLASSSRLTGGRVHARRPANAAASDVRIPGTNPNIPVKHWISNRILKYSELCSDTPASSAPFV